MVDVVGTLRQSERSSFAERRRPRAVADRGRLPAAPRRATIQDWLRIPEEKRAELIGGRIVYHAFPGVQHGNTQARVSRQLAPYDRRRGGGGGGSGGSDLGGWWLSQEVDMEIADIGCRPDVVGWRRDKHARVPQPDARGVVTAVPDFLCEVLSPSTARYDQGEKRDAYFRAGVPHYWLVDPALETLTILERTDRGYLIVQVAGPGDTVRAVPFEGVEIPVGELFLDEDGDLPAEPQAAAPASAPTQESAPKQAAGASAKAAKPAAKKRAPRRKPST